MMMRDKHIVSILIMYFIVIGVVVLVALTMVGGAILLYQELRQDKTQTIDSDFTGEEVSRLYVLINNYRQENGMELLEVDPLLERSAHLKNQDFIARNYWTHHLEGEETWRTFQMVGYENGYFSENLAKDFYNPEELLNAWMESPKHNDNLLRENTTKMGIDTECSQICYITFHGYKPDEKNKQ